ncbi:uncharacterized protein EAE98_010841 [Botrytis deweyae]|uniref:Uncharacterized protein n=1 Tax=Botrytis deweyae TaxID=2478750 RepID=A0ABQ7I7C6_9HELO|nr:uncharacterized protein EAE98_010841 [Botrytis deweyae]KAF7915986.1 hypothetical protein EAE98_010841 [Botrytis deweyae]
MDPLTPKGTHIRFAGPTPFARKYGHPKGGIHSVLKSYLPQLKSGLTPVTPAQFLKPQDKLNLDERLELYQRIRFSGFTAAELKSVLALPDSQETISRRIDYGSDLGKVPIHPLLERSNWLYELPKNLASVWNAMLPAIKIVSSVIANIHTWDWFNALLKGELVEIPETELPPDFGLHAMRFKSKEDRKNKELASYAIELLGKMSKQVNYALVGAKSTQDGMAELGNFQAGLTRWSPRRGTSSSPPEHRATLVTIAYELVEPLLNPLLLPEDRALDDFRLAEDILHETAHAMGHQMVRMNKELEGWGWAEPYFDDEPIPELGFSATNQVFGGISLSVINPVDTAGYSSGGLIFYNWPTYRHEFYTATMPVLAPEKQKNWENIMYYPIPVSYFMSLECEEFWDVYVRKFGSKATQAGPKIIGVIRRRGETAATLRHTTGTPGPEKKAPGVFSRRTTKVTHSFEAEKRKLALIIKEASKNVHPKVLSPRLPTGEYGFQPIIGRADRADAVEMDCPRYDEIRMYLERNKFALAIHTFKYQLPAHLVRCYILRHGGIELTNGEWKTFLLVANTKDELFYYSLAAYGVVQVNYKGWMDPTPPQQTEIKVPPQPDAQLTEIFDFICRHNLKDVDAHQESRDIDAFLLMYDSNIIWQIEKSKGTRTELLEHPDMPDGFTDDEAGEELFMACVWHSPYFTDAPYRQGVVRRASLDAPGIGPYVPPPLKNIHQSLTRGDPMRLGVKDILGEDADEMSMW